MNQSKKIKRILWSFIILLPIITYLSFAGIKYDEAYKAYEKVFKFGEDSEIDVALRRIDVAESFIIFNKSLSSLKAQLLYKKKDYRKVLEAVRKKNGFLYKAILYEHLEKSDSAKMFYKKAIPKLKKNLKKNRKNPALSYEIERQIAMLYTFTNQPDKANEFLREIPDDIDSKMRILHYDFFLENYVSGGYKDFLEGETILFGTDSIPQKIDIDSLIKANRFYHSSRLGDEYKILRIFEEKALDIGMNKIKN